MSSRVGSADPGKTLRARKLTSRTLSRELGGRVVTIVCSPTCAVGVDASRHHWKKLRYVSTWRPALRSASDAKLRVEVDAINRFRRRKSAVPEFSDNVRSVVRVLFVIYGSRLPKAGFATMGRFDQGRAAKPDSEFLHRRREDIVNGCCCPKPFRQRP